MNPSLNNKTLTIFVLFGLALLAAYSIYKPFILPISVAVLLVMGTFNLTQYFVDKTGSKKISTLIMVLLLILLILAPIFYVATEGVGYIVQMDKETIEQTVSKARELVDGVPYISDWADKYLNADELSKYLKEISIYATKMGTAGLGFIKNLIFVIVFYAVINYYSGRFFSLLKSLVPVSSKRSSKMIDEVSSTMEVVFYSTIVTAIFEGFLFGIFVSYFGFDGLLFGVLYGFASLIPFVGGALIWVPVSLYSWSEIGPEAGISIALYSVIVISIIADTFIKPMIIKVIKEDLLKSKTTINEIIIFFSIVAGMSAYGFWGAIIGPAITTFLVTMSVIFMEHNKHIVNEIEEVSNKSLSDS